MNDNDKKLNVALSVEDLKELIRVAKEPDAETAAKIASDKAYREQAMKNMIAEAGQMEASKKQRQDSCSHRKPDGTSGIAGQIHSDGNVWPLCIICQKLFKPYPAPRELVGGMGF